MSNPIERMKNLVNYLPSKDIILGKKFIESRDFESLQELVDSARYKIKKNLASGNPKEEYTKIDLGKLDDLKAEVDSYAMVLNLPDEEESYEEYEDDWEEEL